MIAEIERKKDKETREANVQFELGKAVVGGWKSRDQFVSSILWIRVRHLASCADHQGYQSIKIRLT